MFAQVYIVYVIYASFPIIFPISECFERGKARNVGSSSEFIFRPLETSFEAGAIIEKAANNSNAVFKNGFVSHIAFEVGWERGHFQMDSVSSSFQPKQ